MQRIKNSPTYKENVEFSKVEYFLGSDLQPLADDAIARAQLHVELSDAISLLAEREQLVLRAFYGIGAPQMTFAEIGKTYGMSREGKADTQQGSPPFALKDKVHCNRVAAAVPSGETLDCFAAACTVKQILLYNR